MFWLWKAKRRSHLAQTVHKDSLGRLWCGLPN
ncbi:hypothetical protein AB205_0190030 [Aquarana catesbeiana]|uniref:Uncharacterized protein n=1 Tax=Aquarana catesbeiana TaxID=8400 RepID=A0A2G9R530_AQUCT|nr:hypothetical protein AB205_0190030 [Aquarana catesbeiana]